jgi:type II secretory pathway pseudopilin PulG
MDRRQRTHQAFTLVELALAVTLIALLTLAGIPQFRALYERSELQREAQTLTSTMRYAQERAVIERQPTRVVIDMENNSYYFPVEEEEERRHYQSRARQRSRKLSRSRRDRVTERKEVRHKLPEQYVFEFFMKVGDRHEVRRGEGEVYFYPDGSADAVYITILRLAQKEEDERRMFLKTSSATGQIKTFEGYTQEDGSRFFEGYYDEEY